MQSFTNNDVFSLILKKSNYLQPALKKIADFIMNHPEISKTITTKALASECQVAESTITRFVHEMGFKNFQELKISIAEYLSVAQGNFSNIDEKYVYEGISKRDDSTVISEKIFYRVVQTLEETKKILNHEQISRAVEYIENAETLIFSCLGSSCVAAEEAVIRFSRAGKKCLLYLDESSQLINSAITNERDVVIGISNSGRSNAVIHSLQNARKNGAKSIAITALDDSPIVKHADICLFTPTKNIQPSTGLDWESTSSKSAQIYIMDILYAYFANRNYNQSLKYLDATYEAIRNTRNHAN